MGPTIIFTGKWPNANKSTLLVRILGSGHVVATPAIMGVEPPETAVLAMWKARPNGSHSRGCREGDLRQILEGKREKMARRDQK